MRILKDTASSSTFVMVEGSDAIMAAGPNSFSTTRDAGNFVNGPLSINTPVDNIKISGMFKMNPLLATGLPSTIITPIPTLLIDVPIKGLASFAGVAGLVASLL